MLTARTGKPGNHVLIGYFIPFSFSASARCSPDFQSASGSLSHPACYLCLANNHPMLPELQIFQGPDDKLFSAHSAKSFLADGLRKTIVVAGCYLSLRRHLADVQVHLSGVETALDSRWVNALINKSHGGNSNQSWKQEKKHFEVYWMPRCLSSVVHPCFISLHSLPINEVGKLIVYQMLISCNVYVLLT